MHDTLKQEWASLCRYSGLYARQEPYDAYHVVNPDNNRRPDIEIRGLQERGLYADVTLTSPVCSTLTANNCRIPLRSAAAREREKCHIYQQISEEAGYDFAPIVIESYGAWGVSATRLFEKLISHASETKGIAKGVLATYWRRRLAVALHKSVAKIIIKKVSRSNAGPFRDESNWELVPQEQAYVQHV